MLVLERNVLEIVKMIRYCDVVISALRHNEEVNVSVARISVAYLCRWLLFIVLYVVLFIVLLIYVVLSILRYKVLFIVLFIVRATIHVPSRSLSLYDRKRERPIERFPENQSNPISQKQNPELIEEAPSRIAIPFGKAERWDVP